MIKKNIKAIYICAWIVFVLNVTSFLEMIAIHISFIYDSSGPASMLYLVFESVPYMLPSIILLLIILACNMNNYNDYKKEEAILYIGFTLLFMSLASILQLIINLPEMVSIIQLHRNIGLTNAPLVTQLISGLIAVLELIVGSIMVIIGMRLNSSIREYD